MFWRRRKDDDDLQEALRILENTEKRVAVLESTVDEMADVLARLEHESGRPLGKRLAELKRK